MLAFPILPMLVFGFITTVILTPISRILAFRVGIVKEPGRSRDLHQQTMPLLGGVAIFIAIALALLLFSPDGWQAEFLAILFGTALVAFIGLLDDRFSLPWGLRLVVMTLAAVVLILNDIQIHLTYHVGVDILLTILWVLTLVNALNFMDNMDGLSAGTAAICAGTLTIIAYTQGQYLVSAMAASLTGSALGFLVFNFYPSSSFMGDMGAYVLGYILAVSGIKLTFSAQPLSVTWMVPIFALGLPLFDISLVVFTRLVEGRSPWQGGRDHSSHRLLAAGLGQRQTLALLYSLAALLGAMALYISLAPAETAWRVGILGFLLMGILFWVMQGLRARFGEGGG
ncbi:MAG: MraY family glycosyltransferase [Anaerolineaceae bacterium]|nr:MraY family glycosyltransferase [Anaerolineaceae bacterium]